MVSCLALTWRVSTLRLLFKSQKAALLSEAISYPINYHRQKSVTNLVRFYSNPPDENFRVAPGGGSHPIKKKRRSQLLDREKEQLERDQRYRDKRDNMIYPGGEDAEAETVRTKRDPSTTSVILFPGQGSQYVGMCGDPNSMSKEVSQMYEIASDILGYDLLDLCINGPIEKLNRTVYCQPAIFVASLAAIEKLKEIDYQSLENCVSVAGFSVGEFTALVFSGILSFEDGLKLVKGRAEAMQLASELVPGAMATILYGADSKVNYSLLVAREWCKRQYGIEDPVCSIANYLFPHAKVIGGHLKAIEFLENNYKDFNIRKVRRLPVSGAFHTKLMEPAVESMENLLYAIENINPPRMPVFSNVTGRRYHTAKEMVKNLKKQMYKPVLWEQTVQYIYQRPKETDFPRTFECGPGNSLSTILKAVNAKAHVKCTPISV